MIKVFFTLLLIIVFVTQTLSQIINLDVSNPAPRKGQDVELTYNIANVGTGKFTLTNITKDTGLVNLGPFMLRIDGCDYKTDSLVLTIFPELPAIRNHIWVRQMNYRGIYYLITEQRVADAGERGSASSGLSSITFNAKTEYAKINDMIIPADELKIMSRYSTSYSQTLNSQDGNSLDVVGYKLSVYIIEFGKQYSGTFKLTKDYFLNFPQNIAFEDVLITK